MLARRRPPQLLLLLPVLALVALLAAPIGAAHAASLDMARGTSGISGPGSPKTFSVEVERGLGESADRVAQEVERRIFDHRAWTVGGRQTWQRVASSSASVRIVLVSPSTTNRMCAPLQVAGYWNCARGRTVVLNHARWIKPAPTYGSLVDEYRTLMVMHELGHVLGHGHASCGRAGSYASPMMQQGKGLQGCKRNPWPQPEARKLRSRCSMRASATSSPRYVRLTARIEWVGLPSIVKIDERVDGAWVTSRARVTTSAGAASVVLPTEASFMRLRFDGSDARTGCSAIVDVRGARGERA